MDTSRRFAALAAITGLLPPPRPIPTVCYQFRDRPIRGKISRNAPCPCGSGLKHKKCCGMKPA